MAVLCQKLWDSAWEEMRSWEAGAEVRGWLGGPLFVFRTVGWPQGEGSARADNTAFRP